MMPLFIRVLILAALLAVLVCTRTPGESDDSRWRFALGAGAIVAPAYQGSDEANVAALPMIEIGWNDRFFFSVPRGLGVHIYRGRSTALSVSVGYDFGRRESSSADLSGLGDVEGVFTVGAQGEYRLGPLSGYLSAKRFLGGSDGLDVRSGVRAMLPLALLGGTPVPGRDQPAGGDRSDGGGGGAPPGPVLLAGVSTDWANVEFMPSYFAVRESQALRSGLPAHEADAGFRSFNAELGIMSPLGERWLVHATFAYSRLLGDAAASPVVRDENQVRIALFTSFRL